LHGAGRRFDRLLDMLGRPEWALSPHWQDPDLAKDPATIEEFNGHLIGWLAARGKRDVWREARRARVLCGPLFTIAEIVADPELRGRGFWAEVDHPALGHLELPGRPSVMSDSPWELRRPAPIRGQHTREVLEEAGYTGTEIERLQSAGVVEGQ
jgi:crotonobetainyl-CoA:carnitine CoA-transferase CaiB-like acyl-CoA transferase